LFTPNYHDGVIQHLILDISEDDFDVTNGGQVEIIGWLYQYYNTEPKDQAFRKRKYSESDIPAVTQLFTPDWIVKYMVENSLGRYWINVLQAKGDQREEKVIANSYGWQYYMPQATQVDSVQININKTQLELSEIQLTDITLVDAAMGSGHVLVYAFDVFMQLYETEGFSKREAAEKIVQQNIFGCDIDTRAFQLSYFALCMKARQFNRRFLTMELRPNVFDVPEFKQLTVSDFNSLISSEEQRLELSKLLEAFRHGNDYGSLIHFQNPVNLKLLDKIVISRSDEGQLSFESIELVNKQSQLAEIIQISRFLTRKYTIGVMNPPYMGSGKMNDVLTKYVRKCFTNGKSDLFAAFMERLRMMVVDNGYYAMITQHAWMFLSSFEKLREEIANDTLINMAHLGTRAFEEIGGEVVQSTTFVLQKKKLSEYIGTYERLVSFNSQQNQEKAYLNAVSDRSVDYLYRTNQANFKKIPGSPIGYWVSDNVLNTFSKYNLFGDVADVRVGLSTGNNARFLRHWPEVNQKRIYFDSINNNQDSYTWVPIDKGGAYRKWYGNYDYVVNWENNGSELKQSTATIRNPTYYFKPALTWSDVTSGNFALRYRKAGSIFTTVGLSAFIKDNQVDTYLELLGILNTKVGNYYFKILNPTIHLNITDVANFPVIAKHSVKNSVENNLLLSEIDWNSFENSWDFQRHPLLAHIADDKQKEVDGKLENAFSLWKNEAQERFNQLKSNEEELNRIFIDLYGLNDELTPDVADKDVTVRQADEKRDILSFLSYFIGCVFGRYSLDTDGLAYAGDDWDSTKYHKFVPNKDNLLLLNDDQYFDDSRDIINRLKEFLAVTFGEANVQDNLKYIARVIGKKADTPEKFIRKYFVDDFFKDHKKGYQKRPIYWEFTSGKQGGFKALMYLHRYDTGELAMLRTNYLYPLQSQYEERLNRLEKWIDDETVNNTKKQLEKEIKHINLQLKELKQYDPRECQILCVNRKASRPFFKT